MSRLTPLSKILIVLLFLGGLFFAYKQFMPTLSEKFKDTEQSAGADTDGGSSSSDEDGGKSGGDEVKPTKSRPVFNYTPPPPSGETKLKGVVELGASGFNSFIIKLDRQKNWKLEKADYGASLLYEKLATDQDIKSGLKNYISDMLNYGVSPRDVHFVISSGAQKVDITKKIIATLKDMGYVVNLVTAEREGKLALKCVLPKSYEEDAFVVDIGSGNTKISWLEGGNIKANESVGAKYFQNNTSDKQAYDDVALKAEKVPAVKRKVCFIIGGVPFSLAKLSRQGKERFTVLDTPESYKIDEAKAKAGLNIYRAIAETTYCQQFVFDWDANFTIGFLLDIPF